MKNLDFFRQPTSGNVKSTVYGGVISLFSLFLLFILIVYQISEFSGTSSDVQVRVENHRLATHMATIELNLTIYDVSCLLINPMIESEVDSSVNSIEETFQKTRIYNNGTGIKRVPAEDLTIKLESAENEEQLKKYINEELIKGESCNLYAKLPVPKILGSLTFATMVNPIVLRFASDAGQNILIKRHEFHSLRFKNGVQSLLDEEDPAFMVDFEDEVESFDRIKDINQEKYKTSTEPLHVMYFVQAVPHVIYDEASRKDLYSYSYSINHNVRKHSDGSGISLYYNFSPLTMRVTKKSKSAGKLAINI
jgi:hypothetical protein